MLLFTVESAELALRKQSPTQGRLQVVHMSQRNDTTLTLPCAKFSYYAKQLHPTDVLPVCCVLAMASFVSRFFFGVVKLLMLVVALNHKPWGHPVVKGRVLGCSEVLMCDV